MIALILALSIASIGLITGLFATYILLIAVMYICRALAWLCGRFA